jgi:protein SCO1/2
VPAFGLLNRDGTEVTDRDLLGHPWVANFIFTRCALSCPRMTSQMMRLARLVEKSGRLKRISFSVDPEYDTPEVLQQYAESWGIDDPDWLFLTGEAEAMRKLVVEGFRLGLDSSPSRAVDPREPIVHSTRFVLVDAGARIRGYYDVFQGDELSRLAADVRAVRIVPGTERE